MVDYDADDREKFEEADTARMMGERLIAAHHLHLETARIAYLMRLAASEDAEAKPPSRTGKKIKIATCTKFTDKNREAAQLLMTGFPPDFVIEIKEQYWNRLSLEQQEAVIDHELCHAGKDEDGYYIIDHDVQEFRAVVERHGLYISDLEEFALSIERSQRMLPFDGDQDRELLDDLKRKSFAAVRKLRNSHACKRIAAMIKAGEASISADGWIWDKDGMRETATGDNVAKFPDREQGEATA